MSIQCLLISLDETCHLVTTVKMRFANTARLGIAYLAAWRDPKVKKPSTLLCTR